MTHYDAIIIGAGQAGPSLAAKLVSKGEKVALIERKWLGGTCVNNGCTPTKTLIASAKAIHTAKRGSEFGFTIHSPVKTDMKTVKRRKDEIVQRSSQGLHRWLSGLAGLDIIEGHAKFLENKIIQVGNKHLSAPKIFINIGTRAQVPSEVHNIPYFTNSTIMDVDFVPEHLIILGGSYIGLEFAQMYRRFGSKVTVIESSSQLVPREDSDVSIELKKILEKEEIEFLLGAKCIRAFPHANGIKLELASNNGPTTLTGTHLLVATGRLPNTHDLGLENTDIILNKRGYIEADDFLRTNVEGVWALGDVNAQGAFTHTAYNDFEIVADTLFQGTNKGAKNRIPCYALFTDPPLARIGITETEALKTNRKLLKGHRPFSKIARARENGEENGFMKVIIDADTEQILGATILGLNGDEIIHGMLDLMYVKASYKIILNAVHIHPTVSELIPTMLGELKPINF
ncbi:FAD-containing oxidoreductase [Muricauda sp. CAU 1633]|uniref:FAD-containing oxidoreductase n=1 Tax=Allomuricauda sp. CAU 1633 TaxID=2816036 RepID=UPI001A8FE011|nr:FAD-containing oxidoreductase [Muricauda sp. CAU 1633]MBO0322246.1 FAD-containing oxidoreductase [Muricauda sp. CAU 1633]